MVYPPRLLNEYLGYKDRSTPEPLKPCEDYEEWFKSHSCICCESHRRAREVEAKGFIFLAGADLSFGLHGLHTMKGSRFVRLHIWPTSHRSPMPRAVAFPALCLGVSDWATEDLFLFRTGARLPCAQLHFRPARAPFFCLGVICNAKGPRRLLIKADNRFY